eukprot:scaffold3173_cov143-Skeletonema_menzelii.AAC.11
MLRGLAGRSDNNPMIASNQASCFLVVFLFWRDAPRSALDQRTLIGWEMTSEGEVVTSCVRYMTRHHVLVGHRHQIASHMPGKERPRCSKRNQQAGGGAAGEPQTKTSQKLPHHSWVLGLEILSNHGKPPQRAAEAARF